MILPGRIKTLLNQFLQKGSIPNLFFYGSPGLGKTTAAEILINSLDMWQMKLNGSLEGKIDTLRDDILGFGRTFSLDGEKKVVFVDEADNLHLKFRLALRGVMESIGPYCRFIFTANDITQITPALKSRFFMLDFTPTTQEQEELKDDLLIYLQGILEKEGISYDEMLLEDLIEKGRYDLRNLVKLLDGYSFDGKLSEDILEN